MSRLKRSDILFVVCLCFLTAWIFLTARGIFRVPSFFYGDQARLYVAVSDFDEVKEVKWYLSAKALTASVDCCISSLIISGCSGASII